VESNVSDQPNDENYADSTTFIFRNFSE